MAGHGGRREGAGRPTDAAREEKRTAGAKAVQRFSEQAFKDLDALYEAQKQLALGVWYEGCGKCQKDLKECRCKGGPQEVRIYKAPPHQRAGAELIAHAKGRAAVAQQSALETQITVSLGCRKCGGYEPLIPRPKGDKEEAVGGEHNSQDPGEAGGAG